MTSYESSQRSQRHTMRFGAHKEQNVITTPLSKQLLQLSNFLGEGVLKPRAEVKAQT